MDLENVWNDEQTAWDPLEGRTVSNVGAQLILFYEVFRHRRDEADDVGARAYVLPNLKLVIETTHNVSLELRLKQPSLAVQALKQFYRSQPGDRIQIAIHAVCTQRKDLPVEQVADMFTRRTSAPLVFFAEGTTDSKEEHGRHETLLTHALSLLQTTSATVVQPKQRPPPKAAADDDQHVRALRTARAAHIAVVSDAVFSDPEFSKDSHFTPLPPLPLPVGNSSRSAAALDDDGGVEETKAGSTEPLK